MTLAPRVDIFTSVACTSLQHEILASQVAHPAPRSAFLPLPGLYKDAATAPQIDGKPLRLRVSDPSRSDGCTADPGDVQGRAAHIQACEPLLGHTVTEGLCCACSRNHDRKRARHAHYGLDLASERYIRATDAVGRIDAGNAFDVCF